MANNYFKTAFRSLWRKKSFSILNILGLAIGIATSLMIFLIINNELSYDRYHKKADRIYRVLGTHNNRSNGEVKDHLTGVPGPLPEALRIDLPALEKVAGIATIGEAQIYVPGKDPSYEKRFKENEGIFFTDPQLFDVFDYSWVAGNATELSNPNTVVITESMAKAYFGSADNAMGKTIQLWSFRIPLRIAGVFKDMPGNTDIPVRMGASFETIRMRYQNGFTPDGFRHIQNNLECFVVVPEGRPVSSFQSQLPAFVKKHYFEDQDKSATVTRLFFQPLKRMHLDQTDYYTFKNNALSKKELWSLALIGLFLLLVACVNFINLSTAQSVNRAKEIGVRKVLGSNRSQLIRQLLQETALITFIAIILGCLLAAATLPMVNKVMHRELSLNLLQYPSILLYLLATGIAVTLLAGFYPAMVLSGFSPIMIFKNKLNIKIAGGLSLRRALVVFQFVIAQLLVIGTIVVVKQMKFFQSRPLGFDKDGIVMVNLPSDSSLKLKYPLLVSTMKQVPGVTGVSLCMDAPSNFWSRQADCYFDNDAERQNFRLTLDLADTGYYRTFGLQLAAGRLPFASDTASELLVNETTVKKLGLKSPGEIIGKTLSFDGHRRYPVVGVLKDYNTRSLHLAIEPVVVTTSLGAYEWIAVRMDRNTMSSTLARVQKEFSAIYPTYMYDPLFFDQRIEQFYNNEATTGLLFKAFSFLAIFISCLGLYGLVSFMAVQKTKEVGIRKVLGASVQSIILLFSKEFTLLIVLAFLIAAPVGYYFMHEWLNGFYYHTTMGWGVFAGAIVFSMILAWLTVGYRAVRAALANPVKSLKTE